MEFLSITLGTMYLQFTGFSLRYANLNKMNYAWLFFLFSLLCATGLLMAVFSMNGCK